MSAEAYTEDWLQTPPPNPIHIYSRLYKPDAPKALLVFIHGFQEHVGRYTWTHTQLKARGIAVFAIDQRGFGRTAFGEKGVRRGTGYGRTGIDLQMRDIEFVLSVARERVPGVPVFLSGHSMGGGEVLSYACRGSAGSKTLSGVIASSPLVGLTNPKSKLIRYIGGKAAVLMPWFSIPAKVEPETLSHDAEANAAVLQDPLIHPTGTLKGVGEMLAEGDNLLSHHHKSWPKDLPVLIYHGSDDPVTSPKLSHRFLDLLPAEVDKTYVPFDGGYHELHHEIDGMKERVIDEVTQWIEAHLNTPKAQASAAVSAPASPTAHDPTAAPATPTTGSQTKVAVASTTPTGLTTPALVVTPASPIGGSPLAGDDGQASFGALEDGAGATAKL
ncbi:alpha/beta-hydrolase [Schizophyllum commune Loenen D]|nr:alpha/beta-hydrolase [Schizophyllum commune Loenen D]